MASSKLAILVVIAVTSSNYCNARKIEGGRVLVSIQNGTLEGIQTEKTVSLSPDSCSARLTNADFTRTIFLESRLPNHRSMIFAGVSQSLLVHGRVFAKLEPTDPIASPVAPTTFTGKHFKSLVYGRLYLGASPSVTR